LITAKEKFGFTGREVNAYLLIFREDITTLKRSQPYLYENLPAILGIPERKWKAGIGRLEKMFFYKRALRISADHRECQIGKWVIVKVLLDIIDNCPKTENGQKEALEKVKKAIEFFEPIPILRPWNPKGKIDEVHKEWAERLYQQELQRVERAIGLHIWQNIDD